MTYAPPQHGFRTFIILWATQSLSVIGSGMTGFALNVYLALTLYPEAHQRSELAFAFTALNLASAIPFILGGPVAGAWTDRLDRRMILLVANAASAVLTLVMLILMLGGALNVWALVALGILGSTVGAFHFAAFDASYAMLVSERLLARANGVGPVLAGNAPIGHRRRPAHHVTDDYFSFQALGSCWASAICPRSVLPA
jgi:MFS family permease